MTTTAPQRETLFVLTGELLALDELLTESGGELTPEIESWIAEYRDKFTGKIDGIGWFWRTIEARIAGLKVAQEELATKRQVEERKLERLKGYVRLCLDHLGTSSAKGSVYSLAIHANGGKPPIELLEPYRSDPKLLPTKLQKVTVSADMEALRTYMDGAETVTEGDQVVARRLPAGTHVRLR